MMKNTTDIIDTDEGEDLRRDIHRRLDVIEAKMRRAKKRIDQI